MKFLKNSLLFVLAVGFNLSHAGWFGPSSNEECLEKYVNQVIWEKARYAMNRSCAAVNVEGFFQLNSIVMPTEEQIQNYKKSASCFLKKVEAKEVLTRESAYKSAGICATERVSFRFLTWDFDD